MADSIPTPELWSDFDGTGVEKLSKTHPFNWTKYPLKGIVGYPEFLLGVQDQGVEVAGIVSRRGSFRRGVTTRSISRLKLNEHFDEVDRVVLAGSEEAKGRFVVGRSHERAVGMIEDQPHKLGPVMVGALTELSTEADVAHHSILLGVVKHAKTDEYIDRFLTGLETTFPEVGVKQIEDGDDYIIGDHNFSLVVTPLDEYSRQEGRYFGMLLQDMAGSDG